MYNKYKDLQKDDEGRDTLTLRYRVMSIFVLSYDVTSTSEITPCNKIDKPLVVYRIFGKRYAVQNHVAG